MVRDAERRRLRGERVERRLERLGDRVVEARRRLVEEEDGAALEDRARERDALLLAAAELRALLAAVLVQREVAGVEDELRGARRGQDLVVRRAELAVGDVLADRTVEDLRVLGDDGEERAEGFA